ncbi:MAG: SulP family sulfate permease [Oceanospirillaceae bacterium]|jgi:SulP family sulfate permease
MLSNANRFANLKLDLSGGLTAAIIALPLALAFGVSSGAGAITGLYGAICVGLFAALFGGTATQISGPTGPMTVVMASVFTLFIAKNPDNGVLLAFTVVVMSGVMQIAMGYLKLGRYITMVPFPVISGFMSGIGVIIIILQIAPLLGHTGKSGVINTLNAIPQMLANINIYAFGLCAITLLMTLLYPKKIAKYLPSTLAALIIGVLISLLLLPENSVSVIGIIPTELPKLLVPQIDIELLWDMLTSAALLAILGAIDSLLTSLVADTMTKTDHNSDKELIGQGIGNIVAGLIGGLPGAGATMRTVANIKAGAKTNISGIFHSLILLTLLLGAAPLAENIPHAVLAGLLFKVGLDIIDFPTLRRLHKFPPLIISLLLGVLLLTVFVDLVTAVAAGIFFANIITIRRFADNQAQSMSIINHQDETHSQLSVQEAQYMVAANGDVQALNFQGSISYASIKAIKLKFQDVKDYKIMIFDFTSVPSIDISTALALGNLFEDASLAPRNAFLCGANKQVNKALLDAGVVNKITVQQRFTSLEKAIHYACIDYCNEDATRKLL